MRYRRARETGACWFFTVNLQNRQQTLLVDQVSLLRDVVRQVRVRHPFHIDAFVVMPDHLHAVWTLPENDSDFSTRWMLIKTSFSRQLPANERRTLSRELKRERGIWQRRFWEHRIRDGADYQRHLDYIHYNPVKHGHVARASDWPYSSIHRYIRAGLMAADWAASSTAITSHFGEKPDP